MKYIPEILWLLSWPVVLFLGYKFSAWAVKYWEAKHAQKKAE